MKLPRRTFLHLAAGAAVLPALPRSARAKSYPSRPVRLIVGFAPGGGNDIVARLMGQWLSDRLGQQFVVENKPGAGTNIAAELVITAAPDGYTILLAGVPNAVNATLYHRLSFNFIRDTTPIVGIASVPNVMLVNPAFPAKTLPEFIAYAKANPGKVNMASPGIGSGGHLSGELFKYLAGVDLTHVPFRGNGPALAALLGGQVDALFPRSRRRSNIFKPANCANSGLLALSARTRSPTFRLSARSSPVTRWSRGMASPVQGHARRRRQQDQYGNQRSPRRPQDKGADCRTWRYDHWGITGRVRKTHLG